LKELAYGALYATRSYVITAPIYSGMGIILVFHRVYPNNGRRRLAGNSRSEVTPEYLEETIKFFIRHDYAAVSLDELARILIEGRSGKKFVVFTFDDGYSDNFTYAYPIFKKYDIPFTIYVATGFPDRSAVLWWSILEDAIIENEVIAFEVSGKVHEYTCRTWREKENVFHSIRSLLIKDCAGGYQPRFQDIFARYVKDPYEKVNGLALTWEEIRALSRDSLVTIGAHTVNHVVLKNIPEDAARNEIGQSKKRIEYHIGRPTEHFSYPFGSRDMVSERDIRMAGGLGFKTAVTSMTGNIFSEHGKYIHCLPRAAISGDRDARNPEYLNLWTGGTIGCVKNMFGRIAVCR
jgi:peptidoglycan/xylan/chitin deacetylase (PgdA/CDA1 family)